jgi:hypothetical protein
LVNAAALLDTPTYYKISVTQSVDKKKQGEEGQPNAAKRLLRGKKDLYDMLRGHIIGMRQQPIVSPVSETAPARSYNLADDILQHCQEPAECSLSSYSSNADAEYENFDPLSSGMTIRGHDGNKRFKAWALPSNQNAGVHHHSNYPGYLQEQQGVSQERASNPVMSTEAPFCFTLQGRPKPNQTPKPQHPLCVASLMLYLLSPGRNTWIKEPTTDCHQSSSDQATSQPTSSTLTKEPPTHMSTEKPHSGSNSKEATLGSKSPPLTPTNLPQTTLSTTESPT